MFSRVQGTSNDRNDEDRQRQAMPEKCAKKSVRQKNTEKNLTSEDRRLEYHELGARAGAAAVIYFFVDRHGVVAVASSVLAYRGPWCFHVLNTVHTSICSTRSF